MTAITHIGTVTDTDQRDLYIDADSGHVRLVTGHEVIFLPVPVANRLCHHLIKAMNTAIAQGADING